MQWTLKNILIWAIIVAAALAICYIAVEAMGILIPAWVIKILWVLFIALFAVAAIRFLFGATKD